MPDTSCWRFTSRYLGYATGVLPTVLDELIDEWLLE
jgi:hypothetical protein